MDKQRPQTERQIAEEFLERGDWRGAAVGALLALITEVELLNNKLAGVIDHFGIETPPIDEHEQRASSLDRARR